MGPEIGALIISKYNGGTDSEGCYSGPAETIFHSGNTYDGNFRGGMMNGKGKYTWSSDGTVYEGEWRNNEITGAGQYNWSNGSSYEGRVCNGLRDGYGIFTSSDKRLVYEGEWRAGKRHGHGVQHYGVGDKVEPSYTGEWKDNQRNGKGKMVYESGNVYDGDWKEDCKEGHGTMHWITRQERYTGAWFADLQSGFGEHVWIEVRVAIDTQKQMCNIYRGQWQTGLRHGQGTFFYADGSKYTGQWVNNMKHGPAVFISANGAVFEGCFKKDGMVGKAEKGNEQHELASGIKLKIGDLIGSGAKQTLATIIHNVERTVLQVNSDLTVLYKHYGRSNATAPRDSTMFSMSMQQFLCFARDCQALAPNTPITAGEVHRIFFRMRRQHDKELQASMRRIIETSVAENPETDVMDFSNSEDKEEVYNSGRAILYREFVEGMVRLAIAIHTQIGGRAASSHPPSSTACDNISIVNTGRANPTLSPRHPGTGSSIGPGASSPTTPTHNIRHSSKCNGNVYSPSPSAIMGSAPENGSYMAGGVTPSLSEIVKMFVSQNLTRALALVGGAGAVAGGRSVTKGGIGDMGLGRGRGGKGGGGGKREGESELCSSKKALKGVQNQVQALYMQYSEPSQTTMNLRGFLRLVKDAGLEARGIRGASLVNITEVFKKVKNNYQSELDGNITRKREDDEWVAMGGPPGKNGDSEHKKIDYDLFDTEMIPEEFQMLLVYTCYYLGAVQRSLQRASAVCVQTDTALKVEVEGEEKALGEAAEVQESSKDDEKGCPHSLIPESSRESEGPGSNRTSIISSEGTDSKVSDHDSEIQIYLSCLSDAQSFVEHVSLWAEEGSAHRGGAWGMDRKPHRWRQ